MDKRRIQLPSFVRAVLSSCHGQARPNCEFQTAHRNFTKFGTIGTASQKMVKKSANQTDANNLPETAILWAACRDTIFGKSVFTALAPKLAAAKLGPARPGLWPLSSRGLVRCNYGLNTLNSEFLLSVWPRPLATRIVVS